MVNFSLVFTVIMGWIDNLFCRFSNSGLSTQSFWFQNMNMWLFRFVSSHYWWRRKMNNVLYIILISIFSLTVFSCSEKEESSRSSTTTTTSGLYVAVGSGGTILTSSDGTTWTSRTSGTSNTLNGVTHANTTFVTVGTSGLRFQRKFNLWKR